jgi:hypothetical protein
LEKRVTEQTSMIGRSSGFVLGLVMQSGRDLERRTVVVPVQTCFFDCSTNDESYVVGGTSSSVVLRIGGQFGIH